MTVMSNEDPADPSVHEPRVPACPFAVFDEFGRGADDRVQDYAAALVAAERERCARLCDPRPPLVNSDPEWVMLYEIADRIRTGA